MKYFSNFRSLSTLGNDFISIYCIISNMIQININIRFTSWPVRWSCNNLLHWLCPVHLPRAPSTCYEWISAYQWGQSVLGILCSLAANTGPSITQWSGWCLNNLTESTQNCQYCRQTEFFVRKSETLQNLWHKIHIIETRIIIKSYKQTDKHRYDRDDTRDTTAPLLRFPSPRHLNLKVTAPALLYGDCAIILTSFPSTITGNNKWYYKRSNSDQFSG